MKDIKLLITDDEPIAVNGLKAGVQWEECGITEVFAAYNSDNAKQICEEEEIRILLCDIEMPGENGIELVRWIREYHPEIECIFLTCHADFKYAREAIHLGCSDYYVKPVPYEEIEAGIRKLTDKIRNRDENRQLAAYGRQWLAKKKEKIENNFGRKVVSREISEEVEHFVLGHLSEEISVEQIAKLVSLHPDYLNRIFKKERGISINHYIIEERMKIAARMLRETDISANAIAAEVGYSNYPNFFNMFKKIYGITPIQYREKNEKI